MAKSRYNAQMNRMPSLPHEIDIVYVWQQHSKAATATQPLDNAQTTSDRVR